MSIRSASPTWREGQVATIEYEHEETRELVDLVHEAAELVRTQGEEAFRDFRNPGSRWRREDRYVFVLDPEGTMLVHPDPETEGKNELELKDISGRPIIRGLIGTAKALPDRPEGWYHYQWPVPGGLLPRWKSSYVQLVEAPSGKSYVVGSGMYNNRMERAFVMDAVLQAVREIETRGEASFSLFHDPKGPFLVKDAYIFVDDMDGTELVNPAFPNLAGRSLVDMTDTEGKHVVRDMIRLVQTDSSGWIDYMWPRPGDSVSSRKSTFVSRAMLGDRPLFVGCGVYLEDAPRQSVPETTMTAADLMALVRDAAAILEEKGEAAYAEFRRKGSGWFRDDTYFFVHRMDGTLVFHAAEPVNEGRNDSGLEDVLGRPMGRMILDVGAGASGEGWLHYMYPQPGKLFPAWKSTFLKRVKYPSGTPHILGCGIYHMRMDRAFIEDVVDRAAGLIERQGPKAFGQLRDRRGPFVFMDTYVFVERPDGTELVNPAQPSLEGRNLMDLTDLKGQAVVREEIAAALERGSAWLDCSWFKPGSNESALKQTYVRKVQAGNETFIVGSGVYME